MIVKVHMLAFREGEIREVEVADHLEEAEMLAEVFYKGQNDHCPHPSLPSVSVGDVAEIDDGRHYLCKPIGWEIMTDEQLADYRKLSRLDRVMVSMLD